MKYSNDIGRQVVDPDDSPVSHKREPCASVRYVVALLKKGLWFNSKLPQEEFRLRQLPLRSLKIKLQIELLDEVGYRVRVLIGLGFE